MAQRNGLSKESKDSKDITGGTKEDEDLVDPPSADFNNETREDDPQKNMASQEKPGKRPSREDVSKMSKAASKQHEILTEAVTPQASPAASTPAPVQASKPYIKRNKDDSGARRNLSRREKKSHTVGDSARRKKSYRIADEVNTTAGGFIAAGQSLTRLGNEISERARKKRKKEIKIQALTIDEGTEEDNKVKVTSPDNKSQRRRLNLAARKKASDEKRKPLENDRSKRNLKKRGGANEYRPLPKHAYKVELVTIPLEGNIRDLELTVTLNLVIRSIGPTSRALTYLIVGDQILTANDRLIHRYEEMRSLVEAGTPELRLTIVRNWNCSPPTIERLPASLRPNTYYTIVEFHRFRGLRTGFELSLMKGKDRKYSSHCQVSKVIKNSRASFALMKDDRIYDLQSIPVATMSDINEVSKKFNDLLQQLGAVTMMVERPYTLNTSPNPTATAPVKGPNDMEFNDDVMEISLRESVRFCYLKDVLRPISIMKDVTEQKEKEKDATVDESTSVRRMKSGRRKKKKRSGTRLQIETRPEREFIPSDVKEGTVLAKATTKSGLIKYITSMLTK